MRSAADFRSLIITLWFRLTTLAVVAAVFFETLSLVWGKARGWTFYLPVIEVGYEVLRRLVAASVVGLLVGTVTAAALGPVLWFFKSRREQLADWVTKVAVASIVFLILRYVVIELIQRSEVRLSDTFKWSAESNYMLLEISLVAFYVAFALAMYIPRTRKEILSSLDGVLNQPMTRRTALATVAGAAGFLATEYAFGKHLSTVKAALGPKHPKGNFLVISFDALSAEDMSLYGCLRPTTPNLDAFSRKSAVFTKFYSASTFTTPAIATILTGLFPSESGVHQLQGRGFPEIGARNLFSVLRTAGYGTGAFMANPYAYYFVKGFENDLDVFPDPVFQNGALQRLWEAVPQLHRNPPFGSSIEEYLDLAHAWNFLTRERGDDYPMRSSTEMSFLHARQMLDKLPDGFFLWVHVLAPHRPYLPALRDRGRFLPDTQPLPDETKFWDDWTHHYEPDKQRLVDLWRLRYDEFIASTDRAFGTFLSELENSGRLQDTTLIVTADHGESFEGGIYQHGSACLTRPVVHVPLIIRTPGQQEGRRVTVPADQTSLAPTILELAGQPKSSWMRGPSLVPWLNADGPVKEQGLAFTQYLAGNSVFKPIRKGTFGVIDGEYEYITYLDTQKGELRPLNEAHIWNLDRSAENPARASALRAALHSRFPDAVTT